MLQPGDLSPEFSLPDGDMELFSSRDLLGKKRLVLYFYPKDDTPGCTLEALDFTELQPEFQALDTEVVGISRDNCISHGNFRDKYGINVPLLADADGEVCKAFDVWRMRERPGKKRMGILRSTFIIDRQGIIRHALYDVKPKGHAEQVLNLIRALPAEA